MRKKEINEKLIRENKGISFTFFVQEAILKAVATQTRTEQNLLAVGECDYIILKVIMYMVLNIKCIFFTFLKNSVICILS